MLRPNLLLDVDSYKTGHWAQMPQGTTNCFGYLEARTGGDYPSTMFFGLQGLLQDYFATPIESQDIDEAKEFCAMHGVPFPEAGWRRLNALHGGYLPLRIRAVPEGTVVPTGNVLMTVESTDPELAWMVGWLETKLMRLWFPTTVATRSYACKQVIYKHLRNTSDDPMGDLPFRLHDFGGRGVSSRESAGIGGAAHLVNFLGTDTIEGARYAQHHYGCKAGIAGFSIIAMEHSTVTGHGEANEIDAYRTVLNSPKQYGIVAAVSDSYDFYNAVENIWGGALLEEVKASGKTVVIRPDSGNPAEVNLKALQILEAKVGMTINSQGYKILPSYYRLIQGDGNNTEADIDHVLKVLTANGYSASNISFGMGGGLLQKLDRDTNRFAFKLSEIVVNGVARDVRKNPKTDASKRSKAGRLDLVKINGEFTTLISPNSSPDGGFIPSEMRTVYENGRIMNTESFDTIRERAGREFK